MTDPGPRNSCSLTKRFEALAEKNICLLHKPPAHTVVYDRDTHTPTPRHSFPFLRQVSFQPSAQSSWLFAQQLKSPILCRTKGLEDIGVSLISGLGVPEEPGYKTLLIRVIHTEILNTAFSCLFASAPWLVLAVARNFCVVVTEAEGATEARAGPAHRVECGLGSRKEKESWVFRFKGQG